MSIQLELPSGTSLPLPQPVNWLQISRAGHEIQMLMGYLDLFDIHLYSTAVKAGEDPSAIAPMVTQRLTFSTQSFALLHEQVNDMYSKLKAAGILDPGDKFPSLSDESD